MDFGIFNLMQQRRAGDTPGALIEQALEHTRIAESLGYSRAWFAEHHFSNYSLCPSPLMMVAHAAALTERIRLGTAVIVAPLHAPDGDRFEHSRILVNGLLHLQVKR